MALTETQHDVATIFAQLHLSNPLLSYYCVPIQIIQVLFEIILRTTVYIFIYINIQSINNQTNDYKTLITSKEQKEMYCLGNDLG